MPGLVALFLQRTLTELRGNSPVWNESMYFFRS